MESQLASILLATLSPDASTRRQAENELESVLANPDAGTAFAHIALAEEADSSLRQISGVMLKKFMDKWWDVLGENNGLSEQQKSILLPLLFSGLSLPSSKLRSQFAFSLSIPLLNPPASSDGGVLPQLLNLLAHGTQDQVHGAMRVFKEVVRKGELDLGEVAGGGGGSTGGNNGADERVLAVVRGLGPVLLGVLGNEAHSASTRSSSIAVFRQCLYTLFMLKEQLPTLANDTIGQVLPSWLDAFVVLLGRGDVTSEIRDGGREGWEGLLIKKEIFKTLDTIFRSFPRTLPSTLLVNLLPLMVNHLTSLLPFHTLYSLSSTSDVSPPSSTEPDGEDISIEQVVCPIIDFLTEITRAGRLAKGWTEGKEGNVETMALGEVVGAVLGFTMMTVEEEENFSNDPNAFVLEEDDETDLYSLRVAGCDFISTLLEKYPQPAARVLHTAVQWRIGASEIERTNEDPDWWKGLEASLACVGGVSEVLLEILEEEETEGGKKSFDLGFLFDEVIPKFLAAQDLPFLQGRSFVVASQYATALAPALAAQYLDAAVQVLEAPGMSVSVKISAVKTIKNFCRHLPPTTVKPFSHRILSTLVPLITQAGEEVLALVLESLRAVVGVDEEALEPVLMGQLADVLLDVWAKNVKDMIISSIFEELFEHLASTPSTRAYTTLMSHSLPKLCSAISSATAPSEDPVAAAVLAAGAIEVVSSLLRGRTGPIDPSGEGYVAGLGTVLFPSLLEGEDMEMVQNGSQALTLLIRKDCNALLQSSDPSTGRSGLDSTFGVIARLLRPGQSESRGLFLGDLVVHLLRNAGQAVASVLPELIKAMVQRIPTATYATFQQSLIVPLAYLIHTQFDATLSLLETTPIDVPNSSPVSALDVLLKSWAENAETFQGSWAIRVSTLALADLFASERPSLSGVGVRGEMIQDAATAGVIMTRSMTKSRPIIFSSIPFPLKALKLILVETKTSKASDDYNTSWDLDDEDDDEDDGDDGDWADDGPSLTKTKPVDEFGFLSDMMGGADDEGGFDNEDEDLKNDPVSNIDMHSHLSQLLKTSYARMDGFGALVGQLNEEERGVLGSVLA